MNNQTDKLWVEHLDTVFNIRMDKIQGFTVVYDVIKWMTQTANRGTKTFNGHTKSI